MSRASWDAAAFALGIFIVSCALAFALFMAYTSRSLIKPMSETQDDISRRLDRLTDEVNTLRLENERLKQGLSPRVEH